MIDAWNGSKKNFCAAANTASPSRTLEPPTQNAVLARPFGPRGKIAPCTISARSSFLTPGYGSTTSTPAS